jgi:hypothetical protein
MKKTPGSPLNLLDDARADSNAALEEKHWENIVTSARRTAKPAPSAPQAGATSANARRATPQGGKRIFRSDPTLKQMMQDYNRPVPAKFASHRPHEPQPGRATRRDFRSERIEYIEIPTIPGRVLRPSRG